VTYIYLHLSSQPLGGGYVIKMADAACCFQCACAAFIGGNQRACSAVQRAKIGRPRRRRSNR